MEFLTPQLQSPTSPTNNYNNDNGTVTPGNNNNISKRSSPAEIENGTYFGMYTIPEAERIKAKQKHLNSKYPDEWAATRLDRVIVSVRMRPNIYGAASTQCTRIINPTLQFNIDDDAYDDDMDSSNNNNNLELDEILYETESGEMSILDLEKSQLLATEIKKAKREAEKKKQADKIPSVIVQTKRQKMNGAPEKKYTFDHVFAPHANQAHVYRTIASPLVDNVMSGVNACVIAYGQTGAGKTYTVFGPSMDATTVTAENASELGVIPRAAHDIFERIEQDKGKYEYKVYVTYMQIYLDQIYDLINNNNDTSNRSNNHSTGSNRNQTPNNKSRNRRKKNMNMSMSTHNSMEDHTTNKSKRNNNKNNNNNRNNNLSTPTNYQRKYNQKHPTLKIREHHGVPYVAGLSVHRVTSAHSILELLYAGTRNKIVASTSMNESSSRSHAIFQVLVEKSEVIHSSNSSSKRRTNGKVLTGKLTCVDLAGSERASKTHPTGIQLKEAKSINKSLCSLGNTIASLSQPNRNAKSFVPWRDSKLTHLLCEALSGNSCVSLIVNIAPEDKHCPETVNSLLFGTRAKKVILNPSSNENIDYQELSKWLQERLDITVDGLRQANTKAKLREDTLRKEYEEKMKAVDTVSANETELLELTLMEQVSLNEKLAKELKVALRKGNSNFASFSQPIPHHANGLSSSSVATWTSPQHDASMMDEARSTLTDAMMNHFKRSDEMKKTEVDDEDEQRYSPTRMEEQAELESLRETVKRLNKELVGLEKKYESTQEAIKSRKYEEEINRNKYDSTSSLQEEIEVLKVKLVKAEKKASIQSNVHQLEEEVKNLLISDEREELMMAKQEINRLKMKYEAQETAEGKNGDDVVIKDIPTMFTSNEYEELIELRKAIELFTLEREQLIKGFAKQRAEWAKRLSSNMMAVNNGIAGIGMNGEEVLELQNTLELERSSFWEIMQDTNKHIAMMKQEQDKLVLENDKLRSQLKSNQSQQINSVEKIRSILSNRGKSSSPIPYDVNKSLSSSYNSSTMNSNSNNTPRISGSGRSNNGNNSNSSSKRIRVKRSGSVYID